MVQKCGLSRRQAMMISGHETEHMFERYNIQDPAEVIQLGAQMAKKMKGLVGSVKPPA
jgi:hypothetical protein